MAYAVKEIFYTLQGEGANAGRPAVFCRFSGCSLWSGRDADRATAICRFCDTDFVGTDGTHGGRYTAPELAGKADDLWPREAGHMLRRLVVLTGGEPMLQVDGPLVDALHRMGFEVAIETNGTIPVPPSVDWITVSPKAGTPLVQRIGQELKLVYPQDGSGPEMFADLDFARHYLQPMDGPDGDENTRAAVRYCLDHPRWRLSLQTHKILGLR